MLPWGNSMGPTNGSMGLFELSRQHSHNQLLDYIGYPNECVLLSGVMQGDNLLSNEFNFY